MLLWGKVVPGLICACCRSKLKEHMQYCVEHPEEISKLAKVKAQVSEVKGVMMENIEKVKMHIQKNLLHKLNRSSINFCRSSLVVLRNFKSCVRGKYNCGFVWIFFFFIINTMGSLRKLKRVTT